MLRSHTRTHQPTRRRYRPQYGGQDLTVIQKKKIELMVALRLAAHKLELSDDYDPRAMDEIVDSVFSNSHRKMDLTKDTVDAAHARSVAPSISDDIHESLMAYITTYFRENYRYDPEEQIWL